jgi:PAS domain S-box-containing protein
MPTDASTVNPHPPERHPPLNTILNLLIGIIPTLAALTLILMSPEISLRFQLAVVWLVCTALFTLADLLAERIEYGDWAGYLNLVVMVSWLCTRLPLSMGVIVAGVALSSAVRLGFSAALKLPLLSPREVLKHGLSRMIISGLSLGLAGIVYILLGGTVPIREVTHENALTLIAILAVGFLTSQVAGVVLARVLYHVEAKPIWSSSKRSKWLTELSLFPLIVAMPLVLFDAGLGAFTIIMSIIGANAVRYRQLGLAMRDSKELYQQSTNLVEKLSLVNRSVQNAMFNVDQNEAVKTACQTAIAITQADKAAIFLINREQEDLYLADHIGLNETHRAAKRDLPYYPELFATDARIINDTERVSDPPSLRAFAQESGFRAFVEMPLRSGNVMLGYLAVYHRQPHNYTKTESDLLEILANQLTAALDNAQLLRALEVHAFEMTHLVHLSRISVSSLDLSKLAADISDVLRQMTAMDWVMIALLDNGRMQILGTLGGSEEMAETPASAIPLLPEVRILAALDTPRQLFFQASDPLVSEQLRSFMSVHRLQSLLLAPMIAHETTFGVILLGTHNPHRLSEREEQLLETAANQISTQVYNVRVYKQTHDALNEQLQQLALIETIVQQISGSHDFSQIISDVFEAAAKATQADMVALALLTEADDFWVIEQHYTPDGPKRYYSVQYKHEGVIGRVAQTGEMLLVRSNQDIDYYHPTQAGEYLSSLAVPLVNEGQTIGVLDVEGRQSGVFTRGQADFLKNLGGHAIISIENARLLEELQYQISTLTSLRELSLALSSAVDTNAVANAVLKTALAISSGQYAALFHHDMLTGQLIPLVGTERNHSSTTLAETSVMSKVGYQAASTGEIQPFDNIRHTFPELPNNIEYVSLIAVPIIRGNNVNEVLCIAYNEHQVFEQRDLNTLSLLAIQAAGHLENAMLHERIRDGNNRMRAILDSTRDGVILLDQNGNLIEVNPSAQRLIGLPLSEHISEPFVNTLLSYTESDEESQAGYSREELTKLLRIQRLEPEGITRRQFSRMTQPNQTIHVEEIGSPVIDDDNHTVGRLLVLRDITEEKQLELDREQINSMAVHDLRSPLASIINALKIAQDNLASPEQLPIAKQTMQMSVASADKLMNLVDSLLDIRKGRDMALDRSPTSMEELIELARLTLLASIEKARINVQVDIPPGTPLVNVDADKIRRVLINLLDNALRYTPAGQNILITVLPDPPRGKVLVRVADSGVGIPKTSRERIFEQYWQVKENQPLRGSKGTGIGLAFCQRVLEAHGERIWVEDEGPLPGASFAFTLPVA